MCRKWRMCRHVCSRHATEAEEWAWVVFGWLVFSLVFYRITPRIILLKAIPAIRNPPLPFLYFCCLLADVPMAHFQPPSTHSPWMFFNACLPGLSIEASVSDESVTRKIIVVAPRHSRQLKFYATSDWHPNDGHLSFRGSHGLKDGYGMSCRIVLYCWRRSSLRNR